MHCERKCILKVPSYRHRSDPRQQIPAAALQQPPAAAPQQPPVLLQHAPPLSQVPSVPQKLYTYVAQGWLHAKETLKRELSHVRDQQKARKRARRSKRALKIQTLLACAFGPRREKNTGRPGRSAKKTKPPSDTLPVVVFSENFPAPFRDTFEPWRRPALKSHGIQAIRLRYINDLC